METRLLEASQTGNTQILHQLLAEDPAMLHKIALSSSENPLHIASLFGHSDFMEVILRLKPEFAKQLNQDGFSPIHMASANGYLLEIVRELLKVDRGLCRIEGRKKWTPLHFAASRGRSDIIVEMLLVCPESIEDVTAQKETALHLAVENSQFEVVDLVLRWIKEMRKEEILNVRDEFGYSVLHLATWRKHRKVGINPPSGIWQDSGPHGNGTNLAHEAGRSILGSYSAVAYAFFGFFNSIGLSVSLYMLAVLTSGFPMQLEFRICVTALYFTYYCALITLAPDGTRIFLIVLASVVPGTIHHFVNLVGLLIKKSDGILSYLFHRVT